MRSRSVLLAAAALASIPTAALARDGLTYFGVEGGAVKPDKLKLDYQLQALSVPGGFAIEHKTGFDLDLIVGYDFGFLRAEGEVAWKKAVPNGVAVAPAIRFSSTGPLTVNGKTNVRSAMANLLLDFGRDEGLQVYGGGGLGLARVFLDNSISGPNVRAGRGVNGSDRSLAWQVIAGMRVPVTYNVELGLKYRYFRSKVELEDTTSTAAIESLDGRFRSHSVLASLIFNIGDRPVPVPVAEPVSSPPPSPPPPATQTCPDGTVILATDACPVPPPPPPPPPVAPVRG